MKKFLIVNKIRILVIGIFAALILTVHFDGFRVKSYIYKTYPNLEIRKLYFSKKSIAQNVINDYNVKFLPDTQYEKLKFVKKKFNFNKEYSTSFVTLQEGIATPPYASFYIEFVDEKIWIIDYNATIYVFDEEKLEEKTSKNLDGQIIKSNFSTKKVLDTHVYNNKIYISYVSQDSCQQINVVYAEINDQKLDFKSFFKSGECGKLVLAGRMHFYNHQENEGLLLTTFGHRSNSPDGAPQDEKSVYGKTLFINFKNKEFIVFSKGHRNGTGMYVDKDVILQTEHGPRGGDEINKVIFNKNYGWPIASYGGKYDFKYGDLLTYKNNHKSLGFEEPIFSFVPSIGISEIIKIPNSFSEHFIDNFLISSLNGRSLYRVKFDEDYTKLIFYEKIFIDRRVRDLKFHNKSKSILLAFEEYGEIGIISKK
jgi:hypothetical protein